MRFRAGADVADDGDRGPGRRLAGLDHRPHQAGLAMLIGILAQEPKQLVRRHPQRRRDALEVACFRDCLAALPLRDGLRRHAELLGEFGLREPRHVARLAQAVRQIGLHGNMTVSWIASPLKAQLDSCVKSCFITKAMLYRTMAAPCVRQPARGQAGLFIYTAYIRRPAGRCAVPPPAARRPPPAAPPFTHRSSFPYLPRLRSPGAQVPRRYAAGFAAVVRRPWVLSIHVRLTSRWRCRVARCARVPRRQPHRKEHTWDARWRSSTTRPAGFPSAIRARRAFISAASCRLPTLPIARVTPASPIVSHGRRHGRRWTAPPARPMATAGSC